jgi:hypothetical protein
MINERTNRLSKICLQLNLTLHVDFQPIFLILKKWRETHEITLLSVLFSDVARQRLSKSLRRQRIHTIEELLDAVRVVSNTQYVVKGK